MKNAQAGIDEAIEEWLDSREGFERYVAATHSLYAVFARSWQGSCCNLAEAFSAFSEAHRRVYRDQWKSVAIVCTYSNSGCSGSASPAWRNLDIESLVDTLTSTNVLNGNCCRYAAAAKSQCPRRIPRGHWWWQRWNPVTSILFIEGSFTA
jgi:hypothetical protein